ncbi:MAG: sigma-54 interaction domain-containing protein, partial [Bacteroidia bacterium]
GKELVAKAIHYNSARKKGPFLAVNMAAIPEDLIESELFGHEKGAFTGAIQQRKGKFELACGGTLFLDEIGEMNVNMQSKLLRVLQEKELMRVGGSELIKTDCRIIAASNKTLADEVKKGNFREDLFYRLYGLTIELPPLRERRSDILLIAADCVERFCKENERAVPLLTREAQQKLTDHPFPGNIRELKSVLELAVVLCNGAEIKAEDIQLNREFSLGSVLAAEKKLEDYDKEIVRHFLKKYDQNVITVAEKLGIGKSTIYRLLKEDPVFFNARR